MKDKQEKNPTASWAAPLSESQQVPSFKCSYTQTNPRKKSQTAQFVDKLTNWTPLLSVHALEVWIEVWAMPYLKFYLKNCSPWISAYQSSVIHLDVEMVTGCGREHLLGHASRQSFLSFYIYSLRGNNYWQLLPVLCELSVQIKTGGKENKLLKLHLRLQFSILKNI